jgi:hypothetical protein
MASRSRWRRTGWGGELVGVANWLGWRTGWGGELVGPHDRLPLRGASTQDFAQNGPSPGFYVATVTTAREPFEGDSSELESLFALYVGFPWDDVEIGPAK